jgi:peptidoglycan/xylan/chitin deacetylase (PgdA/CDA1 family)
MSAFDRPRLRWPDGAYIAVAMNFAWETWPEDLGTSRSEQNSNRRPIPEGARYDRDMWSIYEHAYAETFGLERLVNFFDRYEITPTVFANGKTVALFPELAQELDRRGYDICAEGWDHHYAPTMSAEEEHDSIARSVGAFEEVLGHHPMGYVSAGGKSTPTTYGSLARLGFTWVGGVRNTDIPFVINVEGKKLVGMNNYMIGDYESYSHHGWNPRELIQIMCDEFDMLYEEGQAGDPKMVSYGMHPFLARGFRVQPARHLMEHMLKHQKVWFARRIDIAQWILAEYGEMTFDAMFPTIAKASRELYALPV